MSFFATDSLVTKSLRSYDPWTFCGPLPSEKVRFDKVERQFWYKSVSTSWCFYTPIEASNPNQRASKTNPPRLIHGISVDYDMAIPDSRVIEAIASLKIKPTWYERSLGGNVRLVWPFPRPLNLDSYDFAVFMLDKARVWLNLDILPGLDSGALTDPTRLLCNGAQWFATGAPAMEERELQSFYVECGKEFRFNSSDEYNVPLDVVEQEIIRRFPEFSWPSDFALESTGPSFWVSGSTSPNSAIVKPEGMFSFSAHALKPFYSWSDILGADFVKQFVQTSVAASTDDVFWDGKNFWKKEQGRYVDVAMPELTLFLRVDCRLSSKPGKSGISPLDVALRHIQSANRIAGAAPFVFRPHGILTYQNERKLNICMVTVTPPAECASAQWGPSGEFPWLASHLDNFFDPPEQLPYFLAWWKAFYESGYYQKPMPGQNIFLMGGANVGKCLGRGVEVMLFDGTTRAIERITTDSVLMGDDGTPRHVLQTNTGYGPMYRITPKRGNPWTCNSEHVLVLEETLNKEKKWTGSQREISLKDYQNLGNYQKGRRWRMFSTRGWDRPETTLVQDPYIYGLWLGDGGRHNGELTTSDRPLARTWTSYFRNRGLRVRKCLQPGNKSSVFKVSAYARGETPKVNTWINFVKSSCRWDYKFIRAEFLNASRKQRLSLLAGLLDSDGHLCSGGNTFEITQKSFNLASDIEYLARSLGFFVTSKTEHKSCQTGGGGYYTRIFISGKTDQIPTRLARKQATPNRRRRNNHVTFKVEPIGNDAFFGVVIDGNRRFLLADGTVTHNTMTSHAIVGKSVGGFMDAAKNLTTNSDFNSELPGLPLWTIDDETMGESPKAQANFAATWKKAAANQNIRCHKKYGIPVMTEWMGRILATSNLDAVSSRILGPMDNNSLDKTSLFRCASKAKAEFPNRHELVQIIERELPYLLRWLLNWTPPPEIPRDVRFVYAAHHEESLLDKAHQSGKAAPFKELLVESLQQYFSLDKAATEWRGTLTQILRLIQSNPLNESVIRTLRLEQTQRYLESLQRDGILQCDTELGPLKTRLWVFPRFDFSTDAPPASPKVSPLPDSNAVCIFNK